MLSRLSFEKHGLDHLVFGFGSVTVLLNLSKQINCLKRQKTFMRELPRFPELPNFWLLDNSLM